MQAWIVGKNGLLGAGLLRASPSSALATDRREVDIADINSVRAFIKNHPGITHIFNCAAYSLVDAAETERIQAHQANAAGPENLGRAASEIGAQVIHISTDYVFSGHLSRPLGEEDAVGPLNYYGITKLEGERRLLAVLPDACIVRVSWLFGQGGKNFVSKLLQMMCEKEELFLTADQWGRPTYVPDLVQALLAIKDLSGLYHYANAGPATKYTFGCIMREEAEKRGLPVKVKKIHPVPGSYFFSPCKRPAYSVFDTSKIEPFLQAPIRPWEIGLKELLCTQPVP